ERRPRAQVGGVAESRKAAERRQEEPSTWTAWTAWTSGWVYSLRTKTTLLEAAAQLREPNHQRHRRGELDDVTVDASGIDRRQRGQGETGRQDQLRAGRQLQAPTQATDGPDRDDVRRTGRQQGHRVAETLRLVRRHEAREPLQDSIEEGEQQRRHRRLVGKVV